MAPVMLASPQIAFTKRDVHKVSILGSKPAMSWLSLPLTAIHHVLYHVLRLLGPLQQILRSHAV